MAVSGNGACSYGLDESSNQISNEEHLGNASFQDLGAAFKLMNNLRKNDMFCDITIQAESISVKAHKVILAARCPYFYGMFNNPLKESSQDAVTLGDISGESLPILIDFIYNDNITITKDTVETVLSASNMLQLTDLKDIWANCKKVGPRAVSKIDFSKYFYSPK